MVNFNSKKMQIDWWNWGNWKSSFDIPAKNEQQTINVKVEWITEEYSFVINATQSVGLCEDPLSINCNKWDNLHSILNKLHKEALNSGKKHYTDWEPGTVNAFATNSKGYRFGNWERLELRWNQIYLINNSIENCICDEWWGVENSLVWESEITINEVKDLNIKLSQINSKDDISDEYIDSLIKYV